MMMVDFVPGMSPEEASRWNDFIVCVEMLGFAALNNRAFSYKGTAVYLRFGPIGKNRMFFVTSACARRPGAAARVERRRRER